MLAETAPGDLFRGFQTEKNAVLFQGQTYEIDPVSRAVEELQARAEAEMQKPRFDTDA